MQKSGQDDEKGQLSCGAKHLFFLIEKKQKSRSLASLGMTWSGAFHQRATD
jgi:hypothetical protein